MKHQTKQPQLLESLSKSQELDFSQLPFKIFVAGWYSHEAGQNGDGWVQFKITRFHNVSHFLAHELSQYVVCIPAGVYHKKS